MSKLAICIMLFVICLTTYATPKADSLLHLIEHAESKEEQINLLNQIAEHYKRIDKSKALDYANRAFKLASKHNYTNEKAEALRIIGYNIGEQGNIDSALNCINTAIEMFKSSDNKFGLMRAYNNVGFFYTDMNRYEEAYKYIQTALKLAEDENCLIELAKSNTNMAALYYQKSKFDKAILYYTKGMELYKKQNDLNGMSACLLNIGNVYFNLNDYDKALEKYLESKEYKIKENDQRGLIALSNNIGSVYLKFKKYDLALKYYQNAIKLSEEQGLARNRAYSINNMAMIFAEKGEYAKAIEKFNESIDIKTAIKDSYGKAFSLLYLGKVYTKIGMPEKTIELLKNAEKLAQKAYSKTLLKDIYKDLSDLYVNNEKYKEGYFYQIKYKSLYDSIFNENTNKRMLEIQAKFEAEKKEKEIELLQSKQEAQSAKLLKQTFMIYAIVLLLLLISIVACVLFLSRKKIRRSHQKLKEKNREVIKQKEEIISQAIKLTDANKRLTELDRFKEEMTGMIVHDLKNPLNAIIGLSELNTMQKYKALIHNSAKQMLTMVMNILDLQKFESAELELFKENNKIYNVAIDAIEQVAFLCRKRKITIQNNINLSIEANVDSPLIERVLINLLTNAIKYSPTNSEIEIGADIISNADSSMKMLKVFVRDQGEGIPDKHQQVIFDRFAQYKAKQLGQIRSSGIGLSFCKSVIEAHNGEIGVMSEIGHGALFWFTLPLPECNTISNINVIKEVNVFSEN